jgi:hypothetical protein
MLPHIVIVSPSMHDPNMLQWEDLMHIIRGECVKNAFDDELFEWWSHQIIAIDD